VGGDLKKLTNSRQIAEKFARKNKDVIRSVRNLVKRNPELSKHFIEDNYTACNGKINVQFLIDETGAGILMNKFKYNIRSARFEYKYLNEIEDFLNMMNIEYIEQYQVGNYKIDLYIPKFNLAIEIDEKEHKYKKNYDLIRQNYIENKIHCKFVRVNEGESCGSMIARVIKEMDLLSYRCA